MISFCTEFVFLCVLWTGYGTSKLNYVSNISSISRVCLIIKIKDACLEQPFSSACDVKSQIMFGNWLLVLQMFHSRYPRCASDKWSLTSHSYYVKNNTWEEEAPQNYLSQLQAISTRKIWESCKRLWTSKKLLFSP